MSDYLDFKLVAPGRHPALRQLRQRRTAQVVATRSTLPDTGHLHARARPRGPVAWAHATLQLASVPADTTTTIRADGPVRTVVTTAAAGQNATLTFTGTAGERGRAHRAGHHRHRLRRLRDQDAQRAARLRQLREHGGRRWSDALTLPDDRRLHDRDRPGRPRPPAGRRTSWPRCPPTRTGTLAVDGPDVPVTNTGPARTARLTIAGTAGQQVVLTATSTSATDFVDYTLLTPTSTRSSRPGSRSGPRKSLPDPDRCRRPAPTRLAVDPEKEVDRQRHLPAPHRHRAPSGAAPAERAEPEAAPEAAPEEHPARRRPAATATARPRLVAARAAHPARAVRDQQRRRRPRGDPVGGAARPPGAAGGDRPGRPGAERRRPPAGRGHPELRHRDHHLGRHRPLPAAPRAGRQVPAVRRRLHGGHRGRELGLLRGLRGRRSRPHLGAGWTTWLTPLDRSSAVPLPASGATTEDLVVTTKDVPGLEFRLPKGTTVKERTGEQATEVSMTAIPIERPPFPLPQLGVQVPVYFTLQPGSADVLPDGGQIIYPNYTDEPAGKRVEFWNYDPDEGWEVYGFGHVSPDGTQVLPDPGTRITELTGAMFNAGNSPPPKGPKPRNADGGGPGRPGHRPVRPARAGPRPAGHRAALGGPHLPVRRHVLAGLRHRLEPGLRHVPVVRAPVHRGRPGPAERRPRAHGAHLARHRLPGRGLRRRPAGRRVVRRAHGLGRGRLRLGALPPLRRLGAPVRGLRPARHHPRPQRQRGAAAPRQLQEADSGHHLGRPLGEVRLRRLQAGHPGHRRRRAHRRLHLRRQRAGSRPSPTASTAPRRTATTPATG